MSTAVELPDPGYSVRVEGVTLHFGGVVALAGISFSADAGSVLGIIGPNGSGKTSLLNCISGAYRPETGSITVDGRDTTALAPHRIASLGVARTFQHVEIPRDLTVLELALLGRHTLMNRFGVVASGLGLPILTGYEAAHRRAASAALAKVGLDGLAGVQIGDLPYGLAKRADLARALAGEPRLLLLDEPAAGLNETEREELAGVIADVVAQRLTVLLIEHDMRFVSRVCSRLLVLAEGRRVFEGTTAEALRDARVVTSFLGQAGPKLALSSREAE